MGPLKVASPRGGVGAVVREGTGSVGAPMEMLLERESVLGQLGVLGQRAGCGAGRVVLLRGEAGSARAR